MSFDPRLVRKATFARADFDIQIASLTLLYYDYLLTLPDEIKYIWSKPKKLSTFFYVCCRYYIITNLLWTLTKTELGKRYHTLRFAPNVPSPSLNILTNLSVRKCLCSCDTVSLVSSTFSIFGHLGIIAVWGLRTYAVCHEKGQRIIAGCLGLIGVTVVVSLIARTPFSDCSTSLAITKLEISIGVLVFVFEVIAFGTATVRAWSSVRTDIKFWENPQRSLNYVIFSQGLLYLCAVLIITIVSAVANLQIWGGFARPLNSLKLPLSTLLTARFLLLLRKWETISNNTTLNKAEEDGGGKDTQMSFNVPGRSTKGTDETETTDDNRAYGRNEKLSEGEVVKEERRDVDLEGGVGSDEERQEEMARRKSFSTRLGVLKKITVVKELAGDVGPNREFKELAMPTEVNEEDEEKERGIELSSRRRDSKRPSGGGAAADT